MAAGSIPALRDCATMVSMVTSLNMGGSVCVAAIVAARRPAGTGEATDDTGAAR